MRVAWIVLIAGCGFQAQPDPEHPTAAAADAGAFDSASCPGNYDITDLPGGSHYRLITAGHPAWEQSDTCAGDMPGATHLVVLDSLDEIMRVAALVNAPPMPITNSAIWIGAVQQRTATQPRDGWLYFDGAPLTSGWNLGEPNDSNNSEVDHREQFVKLQAGRTYFTDAAGTDSYGALCECDGKPIAQVALDAIAANRP